MLIAVTAQNFAQTPVDLSFDSNREARITTSDTHFRIPTAYIEAQEEVIMGNYGIQEIQEVRSDHAWVGLDANVFGWSIRTPQNEQIDNNYVQLNEPGTYRFGIIRKSDNKNWLLSINVSYSSDPWIGVDQDVNTSTSPHLSDVKFDSEGSYGDKKIVADKVVNLKIADIFSEKLTNQLIRMENGRPIEGWENQTDYQISSSGSYLLTTYDLATGTGGNTFFDVEIVYPTVTSVSISPSSTSIDKGNGQQFTATVAGINSPSQDVTWSVENNTSEGTTISTTGYLTVDIYESATTITVRATSEADHTKSATATVTVPSFVPVTGITLNKTNLHLPQMSSETLIATVHPPHATNKTVFWDSSNFAIISVDANGRVSAGMGFGAAVITATTHDGSRYTACAVSVIPCTHTENGNTTFGGWKTTLASTCSTAGTQERTCSICGATQTEELPTTPHTYIWKETKAATCTEAAAETEICSVCDHPSGVIRTGAPPTGHIYGEWFETTPATYQTAGEERRNCTNAGCNEYETRPKDKLTSIAETTVNPLRAWIHSGNILHIAGLTAGEALSVYSVAGVLVYHSVAQATETEITLQAQGVYIIRNGDKTLRVVFE